MILNQVQRLRNVGACCGDILLRRIDRTLNRLNLPVDGARAFIDRLQSIRRDFGMKSRFEAVNWAYREGLINIR